MNLEKLSIGQMARLNGISEQTLRLYDKLNLLSPSGVNPENGYRYYSIAQSSRLDLIKYYQNLGFSLKDIHDRILDADSAKLSRILNGRLDELSDEISSLKECQETIRHSLNSLFYYNSLPGMSMCFCEHLSRRYIVTYDAKENLYEYDYNQYEYNMRRFRNYLNQSGLSTPIFANTGTIIRRANLSQTRLTSTEFYMIVNHPTSEYIPDGTYLSLCCNDFDKEPVYADRLLHEVSDAGMKIAGDYYCEVLSESSDYNNSGQNLHYKIMVQIA